MGLDDQPQPDCQERQQGHFPGHSILPFPVGPDTHLAQHQPQHHVEPQVSNSYGVVKKWLGIHVVQQTEQSLCLGYICLNCCCVVCI